MSGLALNVECTNCYGDDETCYLCGGFGEICNQCFLPWAYCGGDCAYIKIPFGRYDMSRRVEKNHAKQKKRQKHKRRARL